MMNTFGRAAFLVANAAVVATLLSVAAGPAQASTDASAQPQTSSQRNLPPCGPDNLGQVLPSGHGYNVICTFYVGAGYAWEIM